MAYTATNVIVGTTAVQLHDAAADMVSIKAPTNKRFYIGPAGVTPATGFPVDGEFKTQVATVVGDAIFGVTDTGTIPVRVLVQV